MDDNIFKGFVANQKSEFTSICGFKKAPFRKKLSLSKMWSDLDSIRGDIEKLKKYLKPYRVKLITQPYMSGITEQIFISGFYCPDNNKIELILMTDDFSVTNSFVDYRWNEFKFMLIQVFCHEIVHMMQFANRDFNWAYGKCKFKKVKSEAVNEDRKYHSSFDEIQAYAHCIFLELMELGMGIPKYKNQKYFYKLSPTYNMVLKVFGGRTNEPTIQRILYHVGRWNTRYFR